MVDRIASSWFVRRFLDPKARFRFVDPGGDEIRPEEITLDMVGGDFTHEGDPPSALAFIRPQPLNGRAAFNERRSLVKRSVRTLVVLLALGSTVTAPAASSLDAKSWEAVDKLFGEAGKVLPGGVHKYSWPRTDLKVSVGTVLVESALALGSWAGFLETGSEGHVMAMGDLMLLASEVNPAIRALEEGGVDVIALHNHLLGESPQIMALHFSGHGSPEKVAEALKAALQKTATPVPSAPAQTVTPSAAETAAFEQLQTVLGRKGTVVGHVLQIGVARASKIEEGVEIPPSLGMANPMNFQLAGNQVAATGDFVLVADEVNPVIRELEAHGIEVTALHSHMLRESPRLFFMHFWALDRPAKVAEGLKAALGRIAVQ